jgi:hypothetical protein
VVIEKKIHKKREEKKETRTAMSGGLRTAVVGGSMAGVSAMEQHVVYSYWFVAAASTLREDGDGGRKGRDRKKRGGSCCPLAMTRDGCVSSAHARRLISWGA